MGETDNAKENPRQCHGVKTGQQRSSGKGQLIQSGQRRKNAPLSHNTQANVKRHTTIWLKQFNQSPLKALTQDKIKVVANFTLAGYHPFSVNKNFLLILIQRKAVSEGINLFYANGCLLVIWPC